MSIKKMSAQSFSTPTIEEWKKKAEESLKGRAIENLEKPTFEHIKLKPLYTKDDEERLSQFPGQTDFRRGSKALGYIAQDWNVVQMLSLEKESLEETLLAKGQTAISFAARESKISKLNQLEKFHGQYPYAINARDVIALIISQLKDFPGEAKGYIAKDPIALLAENGSAEDTITAEYDELFKIVELGSKSLPNVRTILVDTTPYHNGGANAVQELAIAMSTGVQHIEELTSRGCSPDEIFEKTVFQFSIGANFFMELAKLRATRILWDKIGEAYGVKEENRGMIISARTSEFTKTVYDPYVNMLRAGDEAFAAVLGGIQYLHVSPFDEPAGVTTDFSERIARNTQFILKEEAHLTKTVDPAGGSWYVEYLTAELGEKAWSLFLDIDEKGGMIEALKQGWIQSEIAIILAEREAAVATRRQTIVGTNKYVDLNGDSLVPKSAHSNKKSGFVDPIPQVRISDRFEELREKAGQIKEPTVGLIALGELKSHKARTDFITGFLSPGGIETVKSGEINNPEEAAQFITETKLKHYCLCGTDEDYAGIGKEIVKIVKEAAPKSTLFLAGLPQNKEEWQSIGVDEFLHVKSNCLETLTSLLKEMEVETNEEA